MLLPVYMYTSYVSSEQLREYLAELQDKGLVFYNKGDRTFITTAQGEEYLELYEAMDSLGRKRIGMDKMNTMIMNPSGSLHKAS